MTHPKPLKTASDIKLLIKEELRLLQKKICVKDEKLCRPGPKGNTGRRGRRGPQGIQGPREKPAQQDLLVNMDQ